MNRPLYENSDHLDKEFAVMQKVCNAWNCSATKLPIKYGLDFSISRDGGIVGFCEIKCRTKPFGAFAGGYTISLDKMMAAKRLIEITGLPVALIVDCPDGIFYTKFASITKFGIIHGGRSDRNDWQDIEPMAIIPFNSFKKLSEKPVEKDWLA